MALDLLPDQPAETAAPRPADICLARVAPTLLKLAKDGLRSLEGEWMKILDNRPHLSDEGFRRLKEEPVVIRLLADIAEAKAAIAQTEGPDTFPQPSRRDGGKPCGECRLSRGETCDVCGAAAEAR